jgi:hypothetical protein
MFPFSSRSRVRSLLESWRQLYTEAVTVTLRCVRFAGVSGRYIYVRMHQSSAPDPIVQNNPTYEDKTTLKQSAIYEAPPQQSAT